jgi:hypothetical protein
VLISEAPMTAHSRQPIRKSTQAIASLQQYGVIGTAFGGRDRAYIVVSDLDMVVAAQAVALTDTCESCTCLTIM